MKVASISDTHIEGNGDDREEVLHQFLSDSRVLSSNFVVLNGDIFDYATGYHQEYQKRFSRFFKDIENLMKNNIKVVFIEGNHDLHLKKNFDEFIKKRNLNKKLFIYSKNKFTIFDDTNNKRLLFTHGDEIPGSPGQYIRYKEIIRSHPLRVVAHLMPLALFDFLAIRASKNSRRNSSKYSESETLDFFRKGALRLSHKADIIILGHSHLSDEFQYGGCEYYNNGFAPSSKKFFYYSSDTNARLEPLD